MKRILFFAFAALLAVAARAAPAAADKDKDEMGTISGMPIQRGQGGWLGIEIKNNCFVLTFYNEKKKPTPADASSAIMRWPVHYQPNDERTELLPSADPAVLTSAYAVRPPHSFLLHIVLLFAAKPDASEAYVVNFSG